MSMYFTGQDGRDSGAGTGKPALCPNCGCQNIVPIRYGMPGPEMGEAAQDGEFALGGCMIDDRARQWHCEACNVSFNDGGADVLEPIDYRPDWVRKLQDR